MLNRKAHHFDKVAARRNEATLRLVDASERRKDGNADIGAVEFAIRQALRAGISVGITTELSGFSRREVLKQRDRIHG